MLRRNYYHPTKTCDKKTFSSLLVHQGRSNDCACNEIKCQSQKICVHHGLNIFQSKGTDQKHLLHQPGHLQQHQKQFQHCGIQELNSISQYLFQQTAGTSKLLPQHWQLQQDILEIKCHTLYKEKEWMESSAMQQVSSNTKASNIVILYQWKV